MLSVVMDVVMESDKNTGSRDSIVGNSSLSNCHLVGESSFWMDTNSSGQVNGQAGILHHRSKKVYINHSVLAESGLCTHYTHSQIYLDILDS